MPTLTQMQYALAVARTGSFSGAARAVFVSQPSLSAQVAKLEDTLGQRLFDRSARPVLPTTAGAALLPLMQKALDSVRALTEEAQTLDGSPRGPFRLGIIPTVAGSLLPRFLSRFCNQYPDVQLSVRELTTSAIVNGLRTDDLDAGILATPLHEADLIEEPIYSETFHIYCSPELALHANGADQVAPNTLPIGQLVVLSEGHCLRTQALDLCALSRSDASAQLKIEMGSLDTLLKVVEQGPWFTVLPKMSLATVGKTRGRIHDFAGPTPFREVGLVYRRRDLGSAIRTALASAVRKAVPGLLSGSNSIDAATSSRRMSPVKPALK